MLFPAGTCCQNTRSVGKPAIDAFTWERKPTDAAPGAVRVLFLGAAASIAFVKWLRLIRKQIIALRARARFQARFDCTACKTEVSALSSKTSPCDFVFSPITVDVAVIVNSERRWCVFADTHRLIAAASVRHKTMPPLRFLTPPPPGAGSITCATHVTCNVGYITKEERGEDYRCRKRVSEQVVESGVHTDVFGPIIDGALPPRRGSNLKKT